MPLTTGLGRTKCLLVSLKNSPVVGMTKSPRRQESSFDVAGADTDCTLRTLRESLQTLPDQWRMAPIAFFFVFVLLLWMLF